jgi:hypothetical protein
MIIQNTGAILSVLQYSVLLAVALAINFEDFEHETPIVSFEVEVSDFLDEFDFLNISSLVL